MRRASRVAQLELLESDDTLAAAGEVVRGGAAERPHSHDDDVE